MQDQKTFDAVIVGGGVIGLSVAWRAARGGASVAVVDPAEPPAGAMRVSAGMLAPVGEVAFAEERLARMTLASFRLWAGFARELEEESGVGISYRADGALHVALDRDEAEELRRVHGLQRELGLEAEWLTPSECRRLEPGLSASIAGGVHAPYEASVDPRLMAEALISALREASAALRFGEDVTEVLFDGDALRGVRLAGGEELRAANVVIAAGAWSGSLEWLPEAVRPAVRPVKGEILELRVAGGEPPCGRILVSERVYLVPREDGRLVVGATVEERGFEETVRAGGVHELLREAYRLLPDVAEMELLDAAAGLRPGTPDNLPIVGRAELGGLVYATGHYRNGVLLAPLTAEAVAGILTGGDLPQEMADAGPGRFSGEPAGVAT